MYCTKCDREIPDRSAFCPYCAAEITPQQNERTLPGGITYSDGSFFWTVTAKGGIHRYYMNEEKLAELLDPPKPPSRAKKAALGFLDFVDTFSDTDSPYAELPSEMFAEGNAREIPTTYRYMIWIKADRKHNRIRVYAEGSPRYIYFSTSEQLEFVYRYIVLRCKNAKLK